MEINNWIIEDVAWTLKNFKSRIMDWEELLYSERNEDEDPYLMAANAMLIVSKIGFGDCFLIDDFIECVEDGGFIDDDGTGHWVDKEGNDLGYICCNVNWLKSNQPKDAKFIMWYNK